jgi:hypothetical protein
MNVRRTITSDSRDYIVACVRVAPEGYVVTIKPESRSLAQNDLLHAMLTKIARERVWAGSKHPIDVWKRLLTAAWLRARGDRPTILPALDGCGVDVIFERTSTMSISDVADLITYIEAWREG